MSPRSLYFLPAALVLLPACEVEPPSSLESHLLAQPEAQSVAQPAGKEVLAASPCGEAGDPCCDGDSCAEGHECSEGVCVVPFLEPLGSTEMQ